MPAQLTCRSAVLAAASRDGRAFGAAITGRDYTERRPGGVPDRWRPLYVRAFERAARSGARTKPSDGRFDWAALAYETLRNGQSLDTYRVAPISEKLWDECHARFASGEDRE